MLIAGIVFSTPPPGGGATFITPRMTAMMHIVGFTNLDDEQVGIRVYTLSNVTTEAGSKGTVRVHLQSEPTAPILFSVSKSFRTLPTGRIKSVLIPPPLKSSY